MCSVPSVGVADEANELRQQLRQLQQRVEQQQHVIEGLQQKLGELTEHLPASATASDASHGISLGGKVLLSGEAGVAFFSTGKDGAFPNQEFRLDEAKLFVDAEVFPNVYFFTELNLTEREEPETATEIGELYLDIENLSRFWGQENQLNVRVGRLDIPFGEEYLTRDAIDNPLVMHSLSDLWGVDEGVELYGRIGKVKYVFAVQNGGLPSLRDFAGDKSLSGRLGCDPTGWLHLSVSGMRTGDLAPQDFLSAMWFGNGFFRSLGNPATTTRFSADLVEGDIQLRLSRCRINAAGGYVHYKDNDSLANNSRDVYYYYVEGVYDITKRLYAATRFSQILARNGFPLAGNGEQGEYFYGELSQQLWRLSMGLGYRFHPNLILKVEYMFERGTEVSGDRRNHEDMFTAELTGKF